MIEQIAAYVAEQLLAHGPVAGILILVALDLRSNLLACQTETKEVINRFISHLERGEM
jgi:hypothetical protein